ncbi:MAG: hypothetical protein KDD84_24150, partial [Caldilineaceae bacterium]|nr:hypothetical protein [Caldilineaceae bacterium]
LLPINPSGQYLTVKAAPDRAVLDDSYLFEVPSSWLAGPHNQSATLPLRAELNPYKTPAQASYANNIKDVAPQFAPSPRLGVRFVLFRYTVGDQVFETDLAGDYFQTVSWIRNVYPVASTGNYSSLGSSAPGFRSNYTVITDNALKDYITQAECDFDDDLCASDYVHGLLEDWDEEWAYTDAPMYGMMPYYRTDMPNPGDGFFPRGSQDGDTVNGPVGVPIRGNFAWDIDGTIGDWYAAHEIGHFLDRDHPTPNGDPKPSEAPKEGCGHSQSDDDFPYANAFIGTGDLFGFDMGIPANPAVATPQVYAPNNAYDLMSYCMPNQWISDYTYNALYTEIMGLTAAGAARAAQPQDTGDYFYLYGVIDTSKTTADFVRVRRKNGVYTPSTPGATDYAVRFIGSGDTVLSTFDIQTTINADRPERQVFNLNLPAVASVTKILLVHKPSGAVYRQHDVSANAPQIGNVSIGSAANPVTGTISLTWTASDADNNPLTFDVHYSRDNGVTFQPVRSSVTGNSVDIDTLELGGSGQALLRVTASDGSNTAQASSPSFVMADKAPLVLILNPGDGATYQYGQMINFIGDAYDLQGEAIAEADMTWRRGNVTLGTGPTLSVADLPVGQNVITFTVTNSAGIAASRSIIV